MTDEHAADEMDLYRSFARSDCKPLTDEAARLLSEQLDLAIVPDDAVGRKLTALALMAHGAGFSQGVAYVVAEAERQGITINAQFTDPGWLAPG